MQRFRAYIDHAEYLFEESKKQDRDRLAEPYIMGSILISWMAIESFINSMMQDFACIPGDKFSVHEKAFLQEKSVVFKNSGDDAGKFTVSNQSSYQRLEDKILFLLANCGSSKIKIKQSSFWSEFIRIKKIRDSITHPKKDEELKINTSDAEKAISVAKNIISTMSSEVWNKKITW